MSSSLESKNITVANEFLAEFGALVTRIEEVERTAFSLEETCLRLASSVSSADSAMKVFMARAAEMESRQSLLSEYASEIETFLRKFSLSDEEVHISRFISEVYII